MLFKKLWKKTDRELIEQCLKGHSPAWECLVSRYKNLVYHFPNKAGLASEDCDEVFQETFMALYKGLEKLLEVEAMDQWIATVAKRTTWKVVNRSRRKYEDDFPEDYDVEDPDAIPEKEVELKLQQHQVRIAMGQLSEKCQKLLTLLFYKYESAEYDEVAKEMGIARGSIGPIRNRCLVKFQKILAEIGITKKTVSKWLD